MADSSFAIRDSSSPHERQEAKDCRVMESWGQGVLESGWFTKPPVDRRTGRPGDW